ncbi:hypothetical protein BBJ28_00020585 [Nothophytophthora sp. Chile5]|nr:hypothetical protein BBJ28_00020585 [Nothophytophthora sp. Chile5]
MERCLEEISAAVLDAGEPISYRTLSARSQVSAAASHQALAQFAAENDGVAALHVLVQRSGAAGSGKSETAKATRDPRARVLRLAVQTASEKATSDGLLCQQIYALYSAPKDGGAGEKEAATALATACWSQERTARNDAFEGVTKHTPLSAAVKAFYASGVACTEATARQDFGDDQGEETVSAFDAINASTKVKTQSSSFFKSSGKTGASRTNSSVSKAPASSRSSTKPEVKKLNADSMSNVLTVDSDDEDDEDDDAPVFVKKATGATNGRSKRVISDDEDEEEDEEVQHVAAKAARTPAKTRNVKRKLNASPAEPKKSKQTIEDSEEEDEPPAKKKQRSDTEDDEGSGSPEAVPAVPTKRQVLVSKTRINEEGYMVTEKTYEEVELTAEEIEKERQAAAKKQQEQKKKMAAEKAAKAKKEAKKQAGPPKQRDLRSFFMKQ